MDLIAYAIPFFLLALVAEVLWDRHRNTGYYRLNDAVASLSAGALSTTSGLFTKALGVTVYAFLFETVAPYPLPAEWFDWSWRGAALFVGVLIAWDFLYYWQHRLSHTVNVLWAAHVVHHQSEDYNLSTALRQTSTGFLFGWLFYVPLLIAGVPTHIVATAAGVDLIYQFWVHTQHVGSLGWIDRVFVTPSNHRVHHAQNACYLDKNYGGILVVWDRLFGTFQAERADQPFVYGVRKPLASWNPLAANLQVYRATWRAAAQSSQLFDRIGVWFRRPNWRPDEAGGPLPLDDAPLRSFARFDTPLTRGTRTYVLVQLVIAVGATGAIALSTAWVSGWSLLPPALALWALLVGFCRLLEDTQRGRRFELWRLFLVNPVLATVTAWALPGSSLAIVAGASAYTAVSIVLLPADSVADATSSTRLAGRS